MNQQFTAWLIRSRIFPFCMAAAALLTISPSHIVAQTWSTLGTQNEAEYGRSICFSDVNGDGYKDVIVGAPGYDNTYVNEGRIMIYPGSQSGVSSSPSWTVDGAAAEAAFGHSVASAGDINGDGFEDILVGAPGSGATLGKVYLFKGASNGVQSVPTVFQEPQLGSRFGFSIAGSLDVNSDGYKDIIISAPYYDNSYVNAGIVYAFLGSLNGYFPTPSWSAAGSENGALFGYSVATGNTNGDNYSDVFVGIPGISSGFTGKVYIYNGSVNGLGNSPSYTAQDIVTGSRFGWSVACAGDVNDDGYADMIVGAPFYNNGQPEEGRACVYYGSSTGIPNSASWSTESDLSGAQLGWSVTGAGDISKDGVTDLLIGVPGLSAGAGAARLFKGSAGGILPHFSSYISNQAESRYGSCVSGMYSEFNNARILISAPRYINSAGGTVGAVKCAIKDIEDLAGIKQGSENQADVQNAEWSISSYPNPASSTLTIKVELQQTMQDLEISLVDERGMIVEMFGKYPVLNKGSHEFKSEVTKLASGRYYIVLQSNEATVTQALGILH